MQGEGYSRCEIDHGVYFKGSTCYFLNILLFYVDDMLIASSNLKEVKRLKLDTSKHLLPRILSQLRRYWACTITEIENMIMHGALTLECPLLATFQVAGRAVNWMSRLQDIVSLSSTVAEYVGLSKATKEMIWLRRFDQFGMRQEQYVVYFDNQSAINLVKNVPQHSKEKHMKFITTSSNKP
ncbi:uncharacterized protein LOC105421265 isoform X3 [Amborella trichopoda]|uniref:uncharacterized protein LOC105421265 isoform X2 n=1 Tax=Amborella trichopoda TaxID=13333 RepID=UPI0009C12739|nr:uncharacterized protein LOC105421265 isoform X2 [Amborella trichopoda]XP_020528557.1 uncharacterized protein LOC105421265 isoform X3 [Amborella trichopoda]|eukprot:XP_020528552.1 uncharacterized protein LOC105421265 isoform X2 [Amborella trichopoda]